MEITSKGVIFFMPLGGDGREEAGVNDSPVGCQSRLTEAASSRKKEPYRPHQAKPELVARLEVTSKGVIFFIPSKKRCSVPPGVKAPHTIAVFGPLISLSGQRSYAIMAG